MYLLDMVLSREGMDSTAFLNFSCTLCVIICVISLNYFEFSFRYKYVLIYNYSYLYIGDPRRTRTLNLLIRSQLLDIQYLCVFQGKTFFY